MLAYFRFPVIFFFFLISATPGPWEISENFLKAHLICIDFTCIFLRFNQKVESKLRCHPDSIRHLKRSIIMFEEKLKHLITGESKERFFFFFFSWVPRDGISCLSSDRRKEL